MAKSARYMELCKRRFRHNRKAGKEAKSILNELGFASKYSHSVYMLCYWLLTAVIGLVYHKFINNKNEEESFEYRDIYSKLEDYFDDNIFERDTSCYENYLERDFYLMGMDFFESFAEYILPNHDYCREAMNSWYKFYKAVIKDNSSPVYNDLRIAILELVDSQD